jgi:hypothetical protein
MSHWRLKTIESLTNEVKNQPGSTATRYCHLRDRHDIAVLHRPAKEAIGVE